MLMILFISIFGFSIAFHNLQGNYLDLDVPNYDTDIENFFYGEDMEQYGSISNAFWNTFKLAFVGDVDFNNFANMQDH